MPPPPPDLNGLSPIMQVFVLVGSAVAGIMVWLFGARTNGAQAGPPNIISLENEKLRHDLAEILSKHREAIDHRFQQRDEGLDALLRRLDERLREVESDLAFLRGRFDRSDR